MGDIKDLCSKFAGGFSEEGSECVVCIYTKTQGPLSPQLFKVVSKAPTKDEDPETLLMGVCAWCDTKLDEVVVNVFQLCGGIDGKKLADSKV